MAAHRRFIIAASVVVFHAAALWALQSGLLRRAVEVVVPAEILVEFIEPPAPRMAPPPPPPPAPRPPPQRVPAPLPLPLMEPAPAAANAPAAVAAPAPPAMAPSTAPVAASPPVAAPPAPPKVELPSSNAAYLNNPKPPYPALSKRLGEQGKVVVRVLIGVDGTAQKAELHTSSGHDRLDQTALATVLAWRYVPGKRGGVPEAMWFNVPINFVLE